LLNRHEHCRASDRSSATAKSADAVLDHAGVAMDYCYVVKIDAQFIGGNLSEGGFLSLAVWRSASEYCNFAGRLYAHGGAFPTTCGHGLRWTKSTNLDVSRNTDADQTSGFACFLLFLTEFGIARDLLSF